MDSLKELEQIFSSKNNYENMILSYSIKGYNNPNDELNIILKEREKLSLTDEQIRKVKLSHTAKLLENQVKQLIKNIRQNISEKLNVLAENHLKVEYIDNKIKILNTLYVKAIIIIAEYPEFTEERANELKELSVFSLNIFIKENKSLLCEDLIKNLRNAAPKILNNIDTNKDNFLNTINKISNEEILVMYLITSTQYISDLCETIIKDNRFIIEKEYEIIKNKFGLFEIKNKFTSNNKNYILLNCELTNIQLAKLYRELKNDINEFIAIDTDENNFISVFKDKQPSEKIKWIKSNPKNKKEVNKKSLFAFFKILVDKGKINKDYQNNNSLLFSFLESNFKDGINDKDFTPFTNSNCQKKSAFQNVFENIISSL
ncbi:MAG: hypothetical protein WC223_02525 [Bacteroidales bacterium]|jgi:hypothetical protein